jgi:carbonic anhydrase
MASGEVPACQVRRARSAPSVPAATLRSMSGEFSDVLAANEAFAADYRFAGLEGKAAKRLAVLTCMDSRLDPLRMLGLGPGDAKLLRNAGARVTDDVLRTLVLARYLLDVDRVMVVAHTRCAMASHSEASIHETISARGGPDTRSLSFLTTDDQERAVAGDVQRIRSYPYLDGLAVCGFVFDIDTGRLREIA